jgi:two-component system, NtrC family, sensor kinase
MATPRRWLRGGLSLRAKITAAFVLIVVGGTAVSILIGSRIVADALLGQARVRVRTGLQAARLVWGERLGTVKSAVGRAASNELLVDAARADDPGLLGRELLALRDEGALGFLGYVEARTGRTTRAGRAGGGPGPRGDGLEDAVTRALAGAVVAAAVVIDEEALRAESPALAAQARLGVVPTPRALPAGRPQLTDGLLMIAAAPVMTQGRIIGVVYGGTLLNRNFEIVDQTQGLIYAGERHRGRDIGTVTVFLGDVRVATTLRTPAGERAVGTQASATVVRSVLERGQGWYGRAFVLDDWYLAGYEPLRDHRDHVVGMLYVGLLEAPFLALRTDVMLAFLTVTLVGLVIVLGLTFLLTRTMIHPLEEMVAATKRIAAGDLDHEVAVHSRDEIGHLAVSFNTMLTSVRAMQQELQEWAASLERKVRERSEELVAVQASMAQSEKLASVGRLAAGVAHEINNPLGGILTLTMLHVEDLEPQDPLRQDLEVVVKQTLRCREIVRGLLDFSRQSDARPQSTSASAVIEATVGLLERQSIFHNIVVKRSLREDLPPVLVDPGQLQQVVMNIVLNAVDAMERSGELGLATAVSPDGHKVVIRISDTGKGIPAEVMPFIFEPFFTTKKVGEGTGLGLAIVHGIVTRAGGGIQAETSSSGTTFTVELPVASGTAPADLGAG